MPRIFVSQQRMQQWTEDGKVSIEKDLMLLPTMGKSFRLTEAVYIVRVLSEEGDTQGLLNKVKTRAQLKEMGAEHFENSLLIGDAAYECEPGFVGEVVGTVRSSGSGLHRLVE